MTTFDLRLIGPSGPYTTRVLPPTPAAPFWREADDGTPLHYMSLAGNSPQVLDAITQAHGDAVSAIVQAAIRSTDHLERRRLAFAAARLCGQVTGLWPT